MAMLMRNDRSAVSSHLSLWNSPVPYLLIGFGAMLVLIAFALIILACSYFKECTTEAQQNNRSEHHSIELGSGGKSNMDEDMSNVADEKDDLRVIVIMAGDEKPTFIAKPTSVAVAAAAAIN